MANGGASERATQHAAQAESTQPHAEPEGQPTIRRAARALAQKRLFEPAGDNALELYLQVIEEAQGLVGTENVGGDEGRLRRLSDSVGADPRALAQQTLSDLFPYGMLWVKRALEEQRFADANRVIGLLERTQPGSESVQGLRAALASAQIQREAALESARTAATQGRQTPTAVQQRKDAAAESSTSATLPSLASTRSSNTPSTAPAQTSSLGMPAANDDNADGMVGTPVPTAPPATAPAAVAVDLVLERQVTPRYPNRARRQRIEGWVEVSFMVQADGSVADPKVIDAEPRGVFDREALEAVRRWKYAPPGRNTDTSRRIEFRLSS